MKLNLLLFLGIVVNIIIGATLLSQYLPFTKSVTNTVSSINASPTSTNILFPRQHICGAWAAIETNNSTNCYERNDYYFRGDSKDCTPYYACFLPSGEKRIFPYAIKAQDPSECIEMRGQYYCSVDLNNVECPNCTFTQFIEKIKLILVKISVMKMLM